MDHHKQLISELEIIEGMASNNEVKQLAKILKKYLKSVNKEEIGFK
jgi:hypothetical protein